MENTKIKNYGSYPVKIAPWRECTIEKSGIEKIVPIREVNIDYTYQRPLNAALVKDEYDEMATARPVLNMRVDGTLWCIDGQRRLYAALMAGYKNIVVIVHSLKTVQEEAALFIKLNKHKKQTRGNMHKALVAAGNPLAVEISNFLDSQGLQLTLDNNAASIRAIGEYYYYWEHDPEACKKATEIQKAMIGKGKQCLGMVHSGLWELCRHGFASELETKAVDIVLHNRRGLKGIDFLINALAKHHLDTRRGGKRFRESAQALSEAFSPEMYKTYFNMAKKDIEENCE